MGTVLVSLPSGAGVVRLDDGTVVVTGDLHSERGAPLRDGDRFHPRKCEVDENRCLVGGLLPPGAISAEVVDDRGRRVAAAACAGAYIALLEQPHDLHEAIVCCRNAAGEPVRRPWGGDYPSSPVTDVREPCPACGGTEFDEYRPFEQWRGGHLRPDGTTVPTPVVSCRVCGHEEREGVFVTAPATPARAGTQITHAERRARARTMRREHMWSAVGLGLQAQDFPVYAADGWSLQISGCGSEDDGRLTYVIVDHYETEEPEPGRDRPQVRIRTMLDDPQDAGPLHEVRQALRTWVRTPADDAKPGREASHAASTLWVRARQSEHNAVVLQAVESELMLTVDGDPTRALMLTAPAGRWAAVVVRGELTLLVAGHDVEPGSLRIAPVPDPVRSFAPAAA